MKNLIIVTICIAISIFIASLPLIGLDMLSKFLWGW